MGLDLYWQVFDSQEELESIVGTREAVDWQKDLNRVEQSDGYIIGYRKGVLTDIRGEHQMTRDKLIGFISKLLERLQTESENQDIVNSISTLVYLLGHGDPVGDRILWWNLD